MVARIAAALSSIALAACSVVGVRDAEEPKYTVVGKADPAEIREYGPRVAAETVVSGPERQALSDGFRRLAGYIFGGNHGGTKIAMTAPVSQQGTKIAMTAPVAQTRNEAGEWVVRFFMPSQYATPDSLPQPDDKRVKLVTVPAQTYAVVRFSGFGFPPDIHRNTDALLAALKNSAWQPSGEPVAWFYDPPWTLPMFRRNEVAVEVSKR